MATSVCLILILLHIMVMIVTIGVNVVIDWLDHVRHLTNRRNGISLVIILDLICSEGCSWRVKLVLFLGQITMHNTNTTSNFVNGFFDIFSLCFRGSVWWTARIEAITKIAFLIDFLQCINLLIVFRIVVGIDRNVTTFLHQLESLLLGES